MQQTAGLLHLFCCRHCHASLQAPPHLLLLHADAVLAENQSLSADVWDALPAARGALPVAGDAWPAACHALAAD